MFFVCFYRKRKAGGSETASKGGTEREESSGKESGTQQEEEERLTVGGGVFEKEVCLSACVHLFNFISLQCRKQDDFGTKKKSDGDPDSVKKDVSFFGSFVTSSLLRLQSLISHFLCRMQ